MTRKEFEEAKRVLAEVHVELARNELTDEQRATLRHHASALAGSLLSMWILFGFWRRTAIVILLLVGI